MDKGHHLCKINIFNMKARVVHEIENTTNDFHRYKKRI
jgi:hypothetical protein